MRTASVLLSVTTLITAATIEPAAATFPGNNGRIVFVQGCCDMHEVHTINPDGTDEASLTDPQLQWMPFGTRWSPDGSKIVFGFSRWDADADRYLRQRLYIMDADGSNLAKVPGSVGDHDAAWSPDGTRLLYIGGGRGNSDLFVMNSDGSAQTRLTDDRAVYWDPTWSPDGTLILFGRKVPRGRPALFTMAPDGSARTLLTEARTVYWDPAWSPDGSFIVFTRRSGIWKRDMSTGEETRIVTGEGREGSPSVSPDGTRLAWTRTTRVPDDPWQISELIVSNLDGTDQLVLTTCLIECGYSDVDWQPIAAT